jgi:hypothetical protein
MSKRFEFPGGHWLVMREARDVLERDRRKHLAALGGAVALLKRIETEEDPAKVGPLGEAAEVQWDRARRLGVVAVVEEWSLGPVTPEVLEGLPVVLMDEIHDVTKATVALVKDGMAAAVAGDGGEDGQAPKASAPASSSSDPGWPTPTL